MSTWTRQGQRLWAATVTAALMSGCFAHGLDAPQLTPPGQHAVSFGGETMFGTPRMVAGTDVTLPSVALTAGYRHGFQRWDLGVRVWGLGVIGWYGVGAGVDLRVGIVETAAGDEGVSLTAKLGANYHQVALGGTPAHFPSADLSLSLGYRFSFKHQLYVALRGHLWVVTGQDLATQALGGIAGSIGWEAPLGKSRKWAIIPQVGGGYVPVSWNGTLEDSDRNGLPFLQLALGVRVHL